MRRPQVPAHKAADSGLTTARSTFRHQLLDQPQTAGDQAQARMAISPAVWCHEREACGTSRPDDAADKKSLPQGDENGRTQESRPPGL